MITLEVLRTGPLALVQDLGRPGLAHLGVTASGAADRRAHRLANRMVANPDESATIEATLGGLAVRVRGGTVDIAVTGADCQPTVDGIPFGNNSVQRVRDGQVISLGAPGSAVRSYLAVRGGVAVDPVLGSRSFDTLSRIGPPPLTAGEVIAVGPPGAEFPMLDLAPVATAEVTGVLRVARGPRDDWLTDAEALVRTTWTVSEHSDRVGLRLIGPALEHREPHRQLPSEGTLRGAVQVPPNGQPVILGPDHPVTGGYPVIGVIVDADVDRVSQLRTGQPVRMRWAGPRNPASAGRDW